MSSQKKGIFEKVKAYPNKNEQDRCQVMEGVLGRFDQELKCYAFYKQGKDNTIESIVYVTQQFLTDYQNIESLEETVLNYLHQKKGMQVTFKTSGIDELPLIQKKGDA